MAVAASSFARRMTRATVVFALLALACGYAGYSRLPLGASDGVSPSAGFGRVVDLLYLSLGMLGVGTRQTYGDPFLAVGRWFGVLFVFSAVIRALIPQLSEAYARWRIRWLQAHTVVIGLGEKGRAFVADLAREKTLAIMDEKGMDRDLLSLRSGSNPVYKLQGDALTPQALEQLNIRRASRVLICTGSDANNHRIAVQVLGAAQGRSAGEQPLDVVVHFHDREFGNALLNGLDSTPTAQIRSFSLPAMAARSLLNRHRWLMGTDRVVGGPANWLFVGWDAYAEALAVVALKVGAGTTLGAPRIHVFSSTPQQDQMRLAHRYPAAASVLESITFEQSSGQKTITDEALQRLPAALPTIAFVFGASDAESMATAHRLRASIDRAVLRSVPIFVRLDHPDEHVAALRPIEKVRHLGRVVDTFGSLRSTCTGEALRDWHERLAQRIHDSYREAHASRPGEDGATKPRSDWVDLAEEFREANRRFVDHLPAKMAAIGYLIRGELPLPARAPRLDDAGRERIARLEHQSWLAEKRFEGWSYGERRDDRHRRHDRLVAFDELDDASRRDIRAFEGLMALSDAGLRSDPWILRWRDEHRARGSGAFRERVIVLNARPCDGLPVAGSTPADSASVIDSKPATGTGLAALLEPWCERVQAGSRLGPDGDEFWTLVLVDPAEADAGLALALAGALGRRLRARSRPLRHRLLVFASPEAANRPRDVALERLAAAREAGLELVIEATGRVESRSMPTGVADDWLTLDDRRALDDGAHADEPVGREAHAAGALEPLPGGPWHRLGVARPAQAGA